MVDREVSIYVQADMRELISGSGRGSNCLQNFIYCNRAEIRLAPALLTGINVVHYCSEWQKICFADGLLE